MSTPRRVIAKSGICVSCHSLESETPSRPTVGKRLKNPSPGVKYRGLMARLTTR